MAVFHVDASVISKGGNAGGAGGFARYLTGDAERMQQYLVREGHGREDLVAHGAGSLPAWARDGTHFFAMADRFERQHGVVARHYQMTLPRELSPQGRLDLADDLRAAFFARYPHVWAVHCPQARDGSGEQPHLHVMFSARREDTSSERGPKAWFHRAAVDGDDPLTGGVRKDRRWDKKACLQGVRAETTVLINAALEREGIRAALSHERLEVRDLGRPGVAYTRGDRPAHIQAVQRAQALRHDDTPPRESAMNRLAWHDYKARMGIHDISREAMLDHVRDRFWRQDLSPAREREREQSLLRALDREFARPRQERGLAHDQAQERPRLRQGQRAQGVALGDETQQGVHLHLTPGWEQER